VCILTMNMQLQLMAAMIFFTAIPLRKRTREEANSNAARNKIDELHAFCKSLPQSIPIRAVTEEFSPNHGLHHGIQCFASAEIPWKVSHERGGARQYCTEQYWSSHCALHLSSARHPHRSAPWGTISTVNTHRVWRHTVCISSGSEIHFCRSRRGPQRSRGK